MMGAYIFRALYLHITVPLLTKISLETPRLKPDRLEEKREEMPAFSTIFLLEEDL